MAHSPELPPVGELEPISGHGQTDSSAGAPAGDPARGVALGSSAPPDHYLRDELYALVQSDSTIFEFLQAGSLDGIWYWDLESPENEWLSPRFWQVLGYEPAEKKHLASEWQQIIFPEDRDLALRNFLKHCEDPQCPYDQVVRYRHRDGSTVWVRCRGIAIRDGSGRPRRMLGAHNDLTEVMRASQAAADLQYADRYRALIEATGNIVWTNSPDGEMWGPQPDWCAYTGQSETEVQGYGWSRAVHPEDVGPTIENWKRAVATRTIFAFEHRVRRRDGVYRWFAIRAVPVLAVDGSVREWVGLHRDVDDEKRAEQRLREALDTGERARQDAEAANRAKDEFLAILGHELRNPLAPIVTALHLVRLRGSDGIGRELGVIERQTHHMLRLVDDLLDVARVARGKVVLDLQAVEIAEVIANAFEMAAPLIEKSRHHVAVDVPNDGLVVYVDRTRLAQVVSNLLTNAAKYTPSGGRIAVVAARDGDRVVVRVEDSGAGIAPELLPKVFDTFVQGSQTIERAHGGLGLGLAIAKNLVEMHGGSVRAESAGPGRGSTFTVSLPHGPDRVRAFEPASHSRSEGHGQRVLVVDDNRDAADMLAAAVAARGHITAVAHDGPEALRVARDFRPDAALLDIGLPVMDGYELAQHLRSVHPTGRLLLVAITGYGTDSDRLRSREAGFATHLTKPVDLETVAKVLEGRAELR